MSDLRLKRPTRAEGTDSAAVSLPVLAAPGRRARSRFAPWRAAALCAVTLLMIGHVLHWWLTGRSVGRFVLSDSSRTFESGEINPGFLLFGASLLLTGVFGRFMCGWVCHMGGLQDLCAWLLKRIGIRPRLFRSRLLGYVPLGLATYLFVWPTLDRMVLTPLLVWAGLVGANAGHAQPFPKLSLDLYTERMWDGLPSVLVAVPFLLLCGFGTVFFLGARGLCRYGCPYGGFLLPAAKLAPVRVKADRARCDQCGLCTANCTAGVRVHEQVREVGSIADHNCIRSLDCVSVCPTGALAIGVVGPLPGGGNRPAPSIRGYDLTLGEELACLGVFLFVVLVSRGLYGVMPLLMAATLGVLAAFVAWKLVRLVRDPSVRLGPWILRFQGRLSPAGVAMVAAGAIGAALLGHSAVVRGVLYLAARHDDTVTTPFEQGVAGLAEAADAASARSARDLYRLARPLSSGGIALAATPDAEFRLAWVSLVCGDLAGALDTLSVLAEDAATRDAATAQRARVLLARSRAQEAESALAECVGKDPMAFASRDLLAALWTGTGRPDLAEAMYRAAFASRPGDSDARAGAGRAAFAAGRREEGLMLLREAAGTAPENVGIRRDAALALFALGRWEEAVSELESAARDRPSRAHQLLELAADFRRAAGARP